jgi:UDP-glucuronate 4-epimerase
LKELGITAVNSEQTTYISNTNSFVFIKGDLEDISLWDESVKSLEITHIIHLAAQAGVRYSIENPRTYISSNISGFINVLEFCRQNTINHLIYASSSSVYGMNSNQPFSESERCDKPVSLYAATKRANEMMAFTYSHLYGINSMGLRFFTVYGPWGRPDMAPMLFTNAAYTNKPIKVFNHGNQSRDFTYIDDIINGIVSVFNKKEEVVVGATVCNIGNGSPVDLMEFIGAIEKETGVVLEKEFVDAQPGDVAITFADTSKLSTEVNYNPSVNISQGVKCFIEWYKKYNNI